ncbi:hypothetical protein [Scytonema sp. NUACC26]
MQIDLGAELRFIQEVTQEHRLNLLIYNVEQEAIAQWIKLSSTAK